MSEATKSYVRTEMLGAKAPPSGAIGWQKWVRENLFSGWLNSILTILSLLVVLFLVYEFGTWFGNSVWNADSLSQCREILQGASGACWGVIKDRFPQLMFGFYPPEIYWRPILTFFMMIVALAPILFPAAPRKMLWFSAIFPFIGYWLLWGGSVWMPVTVLAGFVVGWVALRVLASLGTLIQTFGAVIAALVWWLFVAASVRAGLDAAVPVEIQSVTSREFGGFLVSLVIGVTGIVLSLPLGIVLALGRRSDMLLLKTVSVVFIEFIRGVPLITLLFTASLLLNYFLPPGTNFDLILRVIIMVTLFATAYMAEVIRGGLAALPRGQYEAADALGLDYWKAQRLIIMPQALKISIPSIVSTFIGLFKDTTLVVFIGLLDPIGLSNAIRASSDWQGIYWELFIFIGAVFFIFCFGMSRYSMYLERRLKTDHR